MAPKLILSDDKGNIFVHPTLKMAVFNGYDFCAPKNEELIALPKGSTLFYMPHHEAVGLVQDVGEIVSVDELEGKKVYPVSAFMIPGFLRLHLPAARKIKKNIAFPLWPYTAAGWDRGRFCVAAVSIDKFRHQKPFYYCDQVLLKKNISLILKEFPANRLFKHLSHCASVYNCRNAQNLFFRRWEAPLPVSPGCNAKCLGCISVSSHERISFVPKLKEVVEVALWHLENAKSPIVSFGQGCEGEPLLQFELIRDAVAFIRRKTKKGIIHLNTNGFNPSHIKALSSVGLNSIRISLNSFDEKRYTAYYSPIGYGLKDVLKSIGVAKKSGLFVSLNLLVFPGFTDNPKEVKRLVTFLGKGYVDLLQMRNLSIDPDFFITHMGFPKQRPVTLHKLVELLKKKCPKVKLGYFNEKEAFSC